MFSYLKNKIINFLINKISLSNIDYKFRMDLARNLNTSPETLNHLVRDKDSYVRWYVAQNPNTPPEALIILAEDRASYIRDYVARNPNTPQYVKEYLNAMEFVWNYGSQ
jgi:hypothetical protein